MKIPTEPADLSLLKRPFTPPSRHVGTTTALICFGKRLLTTPPTDPTSGTCGSTPLSMSWRTFFSLSLICTQQNLIVVVLDALPIDDQ